jgi:hypothetical protein
VLPSGIFLSTLISFSSPSARAPSNGSALPTWQ